jgi:Exonuclease III
MKLILALSFLAAVLWGAAEVAAQPIRIATWNMNNLHYVIGEPLRDQAPARSEQDYNILKKYRRRLNADIVALQEVNGPKAARLVFPAAQYELYVSGRYVEDIASGRPSDRIYTGFAVRRGVFDALAKRDYEALSVPHTDGRPTRWGTEILVEKQGRHLRLLSVHLKSGCIESSLENPTSSNCVTLSKQLAPLEAWIDQCAREKVPFVILGDLNRALDVHGQHDHLWREIDDADPTGLKLWRLPFRQESNCWRGTPLHHKNRSISCSSMSAPGKSWTGHPSESSPTIQVIRTFAIAPPPTTVRSWLRSTCRCTVHVT